MGAEGRALGHSRVLEWGPHVAREPSCPASRQGGVGPTVPRGSQFRAAAWVVQGPCCVAPTPVPASPTVSFAPRRPLYVTAVYRGKCSHCMRIGVAVPLSGTVARLREAVSRETKIPTKQVEEASRQAGRGSELDWVTFLLGRPLQHLLLLLVGPGLCHVHASPPLWPLHGAGPWLRPLLPVVRLPGSWQGSCCPLQPWAGGAAPSLPGPRGSPSALQQWPLGV